MKYHIPDNDHNRKIIEDLLLKYPPPNKGKKMENVQKVANATTGFNTQFNGEKIKALVAAASQPTVTEVADATAMEKFADEHPEWDPRGERVVQTDADINP